MKEKKLVGMSLSFGVKDICEGKVLLEDVVGIVPAMHLNVQNTLEDVFERYSEIYWSEYVDKAREVLFGENAVKILERGHGHRFNISNGCWVTEEWYLENRKETAV